MKKLILLLTLGLGLWALDGLAATHYVSKTGADAHACSTTDSAATNKLTIAAGMGCMAAGDTLYIHAGTYTDKLDSNNITFPAGTSWSSPVTISNFPSEVVTLSIASGGVNIVTANAHYIIFNGLIIDGAPLSAGSAIFSIGSGTHHIRIQNCEIKNAWNIGIFVSAASGAGMEVLNNNIHNCGRDGQGASVYTEAGGVLISGNLMHDNSGFGMQCDDSHAGARSDNNTIVKNRIYNNTAVSPNISFCMAFDGNNNLIANNICYGNGGEGLSHGYGGGTSGSGTKIYNNTIISNGKPINIGAFSTPDAVLVKNNICRTESNGNASITNNGTNTVLANNLTSSDPLFVSFAGKDFHLTSSSPAKDAGTSTSPDVTTDFDGNARPFNSVYDEGAYEYSTPDVTAPIFSLISAQSIADVSAVITWSTNEASDSQVEYGPTVGYGTSTSLDASLVLSHSVNLSGLSAGTIYHYRVKSKDAATNLATSSDQTFTTSGTPFTATITLLSPNGGEKLPSGSVYAITWESDDPGNLKIEYSANNGSTYSTVVASVAAINGTYSWTPPAGSTSSALLKLTSLTDPSVIEISSANFKVFGPYVK